uniref:Uncharacterized protein n=1 Tax=viral metagenome TaxID=1070528 RepID=A0A6C0LN32_9ZZZZ
MVESTCDGKTVVRLGLMLITEVLQERYPMVSAGELVVDIGCEETVRRSELSAFASPTDDMHRTEGIIVSLNGGTTALLSVQTHDFFPFFVLHIALYESFVEVRRLTLDQLLDRRDVVCSTPVLDLEIPRVPRATEPSSYGILPDEDLISLEQDHRGVRLHFLLTKRLVEWLTIVVRQ